MKRARGELRIVGGKWRGRRLRFAAVPGLRPTPDRLRETLFNWLGDWIVGRRVLDLYAGSGALGIEALSRGAAAAVFVERSAPAATALRANLDHLSVGEPANRLSFPRRRESNSSTLLDSRPTPSRGQALRGNDEKEINRRFSESVRVECTDALKFLRSGPGRFDLVLVDPPWASELAGESLALLGAGPLLARDHRVYLERPVTEAAAFPDRWEELKAARAGGVQGRLLRLRGVA